MAQEKWYIITATYMKEDSKIVLEGETHANPDADVQGDLILIVKVKNLPTLFFTSFLKF